MTEEPLNPELKELKESIRSKLHRRYSSSELCRWWCYLNSYEWPADFPLKAPKGWASSDFSQRRQSDYHKMCYEVVGELVPEGARLAYWNSSEFRRGAVLKLKASRPRGKRKDPESGLLLSLAKLLRSHDR